jgi:uncharacterized membrane protein required for colicin V production
MTPYDGVMIGLIAAGLVWGAFRGATWQIASIASLALAYFFAFKVSGYVAPYIPGSPEVRRGGSMLAAYAIISLGVFFAAWTVRATLKKLKFQAYDRHMGMVLGGLEGALLGIVGTLFVASLMPSTREPIFASTSGKVVARVMDSSGAILPSEIRDVVSPFWAHLKDPSAAPVVPPAASPAMSSDDTPSDGSSLRDLARGARSQVGRAVGKAVEDEVERLGDGNDERTIKRR